MKAVEVRIQNFRSIDDSGRISLDRVTAFVGRNELGKRSLLKALHKFNPPTKEPYDPQREFPRDRLKRDYRANTDFPVSTVLFEFNPEERGSLAGIIGGEAPTHTVCTRYYSDRPTVEIEPSVVEVPLSDRVLAAKLKASRSPSRPGATVGCRRAAGRTVGYPSRFPACREALVRQCSPSRWRPGGLPGPFRSGRSRAAEGEAYLSAM